MYNKEVITTFLSREVYLKHLAYYSKLYATHFDEVELRWHSDALTQYEYLALLTLPCFSGNTKLTITSPYLTDLATLKVCKNLQELYLMDCENLVDITPLLDLDKLYSLSLAGCEKVVNVDSLAGVQTLQHLDLARSGADAYNAVLSTREDLHVNYGKFVDNERARLASLSVKEDWK